MGEKSKIEWTEATWNPVSGCTPISEGCEHCYAKRMATRLRGRCGYPEDEPFKLTFHPEKLWEPYHWRKQRKIFVCSMGDLFHEDIPSWDLNKVFAVVEASPWHRFMVLTKRSQRMHGYFDYLRSIWRVREWPASNLWLGVTAENQRRADERIPWLQETPAVRRFVSVEPMLGPVDLKEYFHPVQKFHKSLNVKEALLGKQSMDAFHDDEGRLLSRGEAKDRLEFLDSNGWEYVSLDYCSNFAMDTGCLGHNLAPLDWVICGGETGAGARPLHPDWVRSLRDQCQAAGVPFFFKSWGEWYPNWSEMPRDDIDYGKPKVSVGGLSFVRCGKKQTGRILDGRTWDEEPEDVKTPKEGM